MAAKLALLAALAAAASLHAQAQERLIGGRVEGLLEFAREVHPEYAALRADIESASARVEPAAALPDPMLRTELRDVTNEGRDASANLLPPRIGGARYTFSQTLPWAGKRDLRRDVAGAAVDEAKAKLRSGWMELATRIKTTYAQHHVHSVSLRHLRESVDLMRRIAEIARTRYAGGLAAQQDVLRAMTEIVAMEADLAVLEGDSAQASARIRALIGRPDNVKLRAPDLLRTLPPAAKLELKALEERVRAASPTLAVEDARIAGATKSRDLADLNGYPDVTLGVAPSQVRNRVSQWELMLEINIPLQQERRSEERREAELRVETARLRRQDALNQSLASVAEAVAGLQVAQRLEVLVTGSLLPQAELNLNAALAAYETGRGEFAMLLDAERQLRRARIELVKARGDQQIRLAEIEKVLGEEI